MLPKISVIVPIYNVEKYINRCIDSILAQTFSDFQLILVDDGSPDNCGKICDEYAQKDNRIRVIHKENGGLSDARNAGLDVAEGKYIYFCDSDDYIDNNLFEEIVSIMENGYDLTAFGYVYEFDDRDPILCTYDASPGDFEFSSCQERFHFIVNVFMKYGIGFESCTRFFKRSIIEKYHIRFEDNKRIFAEDMCFSLYYLAHTRKIFASSKKYYHYYQRSTSIMGENKKSSNIGRFDLLARAVFSYYCTFEDCKYMCGLFPVLYLSIFNHAENSYKNFHKDVSISEYKALIYSEITDTKFLKKNLRKIRKFKNEIYPGKSRSFVLYRINELEYYAGDSIFLFGIKTKILIFRNSIIDSK